MNYYILMPYILAGLGWNPSLLNSYNGTFDVSGIQRARKRSQKHRGKWKR